MQNQPTESLELPRQRFSQGNGQRGLARAMWTDDLPSPICPPQLLDHQVNSSGIRFDKIKLR
jgi:hypothetical protein